MPKKMDWKNLLTEQRFGTEGVVRSAKEGSSSRTIFHKDHDRLVFSHAFRRLGKKTQVHPMARNDHVHNRLTHTMEVGSVGRSLGMEIGGWLERKNHLPKSVTASDIGVIIQSACLAHDIGNPPFGHAGEEAIKGWFKENHDLLNKRMEASEISDFTKFDGNAQGFRTITHLENHFADGGLRLTFPTLGASLKYPWQSRDAKTKDKFSVFVAQNQHFNRVARELGLIQHSGETFCRHPLCHLVEAADDICYAIMDLEDGVEIGLISFGELFKVLGVFSDVKFKEITRSGMSARRGISRIRGAAMQAMVTHAAMSFRKNYASIMSGDFGSGLLEVGSGPVPTAVANAKRIAQQELFMARRKIEIEVGSFSTIGILLRSYVDAISELHDRGKDAVSFRNARILDTLGNNAPNRKQSFYQSMLRVTDVVSGMTDDYATFMAGQLSGVGR